MFSQSPKRTAAQMLLCNNTWVELEGKHRSGRTCRLHRTVVPQSNRDASPDPLLPLPCPGPLPLLVHPGGDVLLYARPLAPVDDRLAELAEEERLAQQGEVRLEVAVHVRHRLAVTTHGGRGNSGAKAEVSPKPSSVSRATSTRYH